jgi:hypothetical protein
MPLRVRVTCAGVEIGTAEFRAPNGLAHERLVTGPHYAIAFDAARRCALALSHTQHWSPRNRDFAAYFAEQWEGGRLGLEDKLGREFAVNSLVVIDHPRDVSAEVILVADFRPALARVEAFLSAAAHAQKNKCANAACGHHSNASVTSSVRRQHPMLRSGGTTAPHAVPKPADISRPY